MARDVSSPTSTGGAGYQFEDKVAARWLLCMLQGVSPLDSQLGPPRRVKFQARPDGWLLDDIVGEFDGGIRAAVSVKSTRMISSCGFPSEFTSDCWEQLLPKWGTAFRPRTDLAVLATADVDPDHSRAIDDLVQRSVGIEVAEFDDRLQTAEWTNECVRKFAASFNCPAAVAAKFSPASPVHRNVFFGSIRVCSFDFASMSSASTTAALQACKTVVASGTDADAQLLWLALQDVARSERAHAGAMTLPALVASVARRVALARHPDHKKAWDTLAAGTKAWRESVRTIIGSAARIDRAALVGALSKALTHPAPIVVLGDSGSGKSAIAAALSEQLLAAAESTVVAFAADDAAASVSVSPDLDVLLACSPSTVNVLVVDQLEHAADDDKALRGVARAIRSAAKSPNPWHVVVVCQSADWPTMRSRLASQNVDLAGAEQISVGAVSPTEMHALAKELPKLQWLAERPELLPVMGRPKVLDTLALLIEEGSADRPANEPDLIEAIWNVIASKSPSGGLEAFRTIAELATRTADERRQRVPLVEIRGGLAPLAFVTRFGLVAATTQSIAFGHDLYADYARSRALLGWFEGSNFDELRAKLRNPRWHEAFRHLSGHLLERSADSANWLTLLRELRSGDNPGLGADVVLDAVVTSPNAAMLLQKITPQLLSPDQKLLDRLLWRFFRRCTVIDPRVADVSDGVDPEFLDDYRVPTGASWIPFLEFTLANEAAARRLAGAACIRIWRTWLRVDGSTRRLRLADDVAKVAVSLAEEHVRQLRRGAFGRGLKSLYEFFLFATSYDVERAAPMLRYLAGLRTPADVAARDDRASAPVVRAQPPISLFREGPIPDPWPRGPTTHADSDFERVACSRLGATLLVRASVSLAVELFNLLFIETPRSEESYAHRGGMMLVEDECGLQHVQSAFPPFHDFPPIAALFAADALAAVRFTIDLVDFATARNVERRQRFGPELDEFRDPEIIIAKGAHNFVGDERIFLWSRATWGAPTTNAMLMALERWLYDSATDAEERNEAIRLILETGRSVALLSVLVDVALHSPELLDGAVEPLITSPLIMLWARHRATLNQANAALIGWIDAGSDRKEAAREWHTMPHRRRDLLRSVALRYVQRSFEWPAVPAAIARWQAVEDDDVHLGPREWVEGAAAQLDRAQFETIETEHGPQIVWHPPAAIAARAANAAAESESEMATMLTPFRARQLLDGTMPFSAAALEEIYRAAKSSSGDHAGESVCVRCAAAAVAFVKGSAWLDADSQRRVECRRWILDALIAPPRAPQFDSRGSVGRIFWDDFCAAAFAALWIAEAYNDELLPHALQCVVLPHDSAVQHFFETITADDPERDEVSKLLHVAVQFARARHLLNWQQRVPLVDGDISEVLDRIGREFVSHTIGSLPARWSEYEAELPPELTWQREPPPEISFGLDDEYALTAFRWLWRDVLIDRRRELVARHSEQLTRLVTVRIARELGGRRGELSHSLPYESDRAALNLAAILAVTSPDERERRAAWEPWLTLATPAHHWVEAFLTSAYDAAAAVDSADARAGIREMLSFVLRDETFLAAFGPHERGDVACAVIGMERHVAWPGRWVAEQASLAAELAPFLPTWCAVSLRWYGCGRALLRLLVTPAATALRRPALGWLANGSTAWIRDDEREPLRRFLETLPVGGSAGSLSVDEAKQAETLLSVLFEAKTAGADQLASRLRAGT